MNPLLLILLIILIFGAWGGPHLGWYPNTYANYGYGGGGLLFIILLLLLFRVI